ncbi:phosphoglycolate phosphatase [Polaromonas sp.]|uniref:phosphoglycolate phosphatase n=1 Tax=Polaromonas sp. TaxID=1869339 RepID=UPI003566C79F
MTDNQPGRDAGPLEAAIVDLDGTMVDTLGDFAVALNLMLADLSLPLVDRAVVAPMVGKGSEHLIQSVLRHVLKVAPAQVGRAQAAIDSGAHAARLFPDAWASYQRYYLAINGQHAQVYPGVPEGLQQLRQHGLKLACLTNKPTAFALPLLKAKGLDGFFSQVFGGDAFERKKPDPLPLLKTCEALGSLPGRTLMIGDSSNDARAARAAGCPVLLVTYGYNHGEPVRGVDADGFVDTLAAIRLDRIKTKTGLAPR